MAQPAKSESQELPRVTDTGEESFSVDTTIVEEPKAEPKAEEEPTTEGEPKAGEEPKEEEPVVETPEPVHELPKGVQKRIDVITRKRRDAERELEVVYAENEALKRAAEENVVVGDKPDVNDFETEEAYYEALTDYKVSTAMAKRDERQRDRDEAARERREIQAQSDLERNIRAALDDASDKYDDFDKVIKDVEITESMLQVLERLPNAGDVAYKLGKTPGLVDSIVSMPIVEATLKLKEISDKIKTPKINKAPNPLRPVAATGGGIKTLENMSMSEYNKVRDKQDQERRGR